ncbi:MAG: 4-phosphopantetheinyl transferase family protein, partial [Myxococcales bacterium]|nr:4-phosphopantetheinyl transferase family protein [Myxococcales bacterium]
IDLEAPRRDHAGIADAILLPSERARWLALPREAQNADLIRSFSLKEAIYKAIDPRYRRYVDFREVSVEALPDGTAVVEWLLAERETPPARIELRWARFQADAWLCTARAFW